MYSIKVAFSGLSDVHLSLNYLNASLWFSNRCNNSYHRMGILRAMISDMCVTYPCCFQRQVLVLIAYQLLSSILLEIVWHCFLSISRILSVKINILCLLLLCLFLSIRKKIQRMGLRIYLSNGCLPRICKSLYSFSRSRRNKEYCQNDSLP